MNTETALEILSDVFGDLVDAAAPDWNGQVRLSFYEGYEGELATATMTIYHGDEMGSSAQQPVALLPAGLVVEPERYRAFAEGVRTSMGGQIARYEGMTGPAEFFQVDLLRDASLQTAADFARAVADDEAGARALAPIQVGDFAAKHDLPAIADARTCRLIWDLMREQACALSSARALSDEARDEAIPHLVALLEGWVERGYTFQGEWFLEGRNAHLAIAQSLETLLGHARSPELVQRIEGLAEAGCFRAEFAPAAP